MGVVRVSVGLSGLWRRALVQPGLDGPPPGYQRCWPNRAGIKGNRADWCWAGECRAFWPLAVRVGAGGHDGARIPKVLDCSGGNKSIVQMPMAVIQRGKRSLTVAARK